MSDDAPPQKSEGEGAPAYWPWVQVIRTIVEDCDAQTLRTLLGSAAPDIARVVPEVGERLPDFALRDHTGRLVDFHADRGDRKAAVVFFRSAVW